mmetsp:Transcript_6860/g.24016  ORF Transcript_6860/g.24016 Transcript_6860/m.24016 type:complete len:241 (-) Transcript_6860:18-740(-)
MGRLARYSSEPGRCFFSGRHVSGLMYTSSSSSSVSEFSGTFVTWGVRGVRGALRLLGGRRANAPAPAAGAAATTGKAPAASASSISLVIPRVRLTMGIPTSAVSSATPPIAPNPTSHLAAKLSSPLRDLFLRSTMRSTPPMDMPVAIGMVMMERRRGYLESSTSLRTRMSKTPERIPARIGETNHEAMMLPRPSYPHSTQSLPAPTRVMPSTAPTTAWVVETGILNHVAPRRKIAAAHSA